MKHSKLKNIIAKVAGLLLLLGVSIGALGLHTPTSVVHAAGEPATTKAATVSLSAVSGYSWGAPNLSDPTKVESGDSVFYTPNSYVYIGSRYNSVTGQNEPLLCRVLDADADSTGEDGAIFVLTEQGIEARRFYFFTNVHQGIIDYENVYSESYVGVSSSLDVGDPLFAGATAEELYWVRKITKTDKKADMDGLFGFEELITEYYLETDTVGGEGEYYQLYAVQSDEATYLDGHSFFLLSAEEVAKYVGNQSGMSALRANNLLGDEITWLTRTGMGETYESSDGNFVLGFDADGNAVPVSATEDTAYTRLGLNIETDRIVYSRKLNQNTYKLAFTHPAYLEQEGNLPQSFAAEILNTDTYTGKVTLQYQNVFRTILSVGEKAYISVMIEDQNGAIKYYGNVAEITGNSRDYIDTEKKTAEFYLPATYNEATDKIKVFYEFQQNGEKGMSFVSNAVTLDCAHTAYDFNSGRYGAYATCISPGVCAHCSEPFGVVNSENHRYESGDLHCDDEDGENLHWNICLDCKEKVNITECSFANNCIARCQCGTERLDRSLCHYDENGICTIDPLHFESPTYIYDPNTQTREVIVENEGQWLSLAYTVNSGETVRNDEGDAVFWSGCLPTITLTSDLDFTHIQGFVPMGTVAPEGERARYINGRLVCSNEGTTIKGIHYESDSPNVGLFGYAYNFEINGLTLTECSFKGSSNVGALVGLGYDVLIQKTIVQGNVTVSATDGSEGAFIGLGFINDGMPYPCKIQVACLAIDVKNAEGKDLAFVSPNTSADAIEVTGSFCLFASDGEDGKTSAETFASGEIAYRLQQMVPGWSQIVDMIEVDEITGEETALTPQAFPVYISKNENGNRVGTVYKVYQIAYCDGTPAVFTNNAKKNYTVHKPQEVLEWIWDAPFCDARVKCALCGEEVLTTAHVELDYRYVPVRGDYTATILDALGNPYTDENGKIFSDTEIIIGIRIETMIGMTNIEKVYDAMDIWPGVLMNNHRLNDGSRIPADREYEVYFINSATGEELSEIRTEHSTTQGFIDVKHALPAHDVGVYDLLVVGKNDYEGQSYIYKGVLEIKPVVVEIAPEDVYKYYDGNANFEASYQITDQEIEDLYNHLFSVTYAAASSSKEGIYEVEVLLKSYAEDKNITFVLTRSTVQAVILPQLYVSVENKNYPAKVTYGEAIPTPAPEYFAFTEGSTLTFEWYKADMTVWGEEINGKFVERYEIHTLYALNGTPKDVGNYILRVKASSIGQLAASYCDVKVEILRANTLDIVFDLDGIPIYNDGYRDYYVLDMGEEIAYTVTGLLNGDTLESTRIKVGLDVNPAEGDSSGSVPGDYSQFPNQPFAKCYNVVYTVRSDNGFGSDGNYERIYKSIYVMIKTATAKPAGITHLYDGEAKGVDVIFSWAEVEGAELYKVYVTDPYGSRTEIQRTVGDHLIDDIRNGNIFATYQVTVAGDYSVEVYVEESLCESFSFAVAFFDEEGFMLDEMTDLGKYRVVVTQNGVDSEAEVYIKREIVMLVKECEFNLDSDTLIFDPAKIVMEAGKVILLDHELVDVKVSINEWNGSIFVESFKVIDANGRDVTYLYQLNNRSNSDTLNVVHVFDSVCDAECNDHWCNYTRVVAPHSGGTATCVSLAECEKCHALYGEYNYTAHVSDQTHIAPNGEDLNTHLLIHTCCGQTAEVLPHTEKTAATCITQAVCADCGWAYGALDPHNHASNERKYTYVGEGGHNTEYLCCHLVELHEHTGGTASCTELAKCEHCEQAYGRLDLNNHLGHIEYTPDPNNANLHLEEYNCCGTSATVEHSGGEETCIARAVCALCKVEYGAIDPHNHATENRLYTVRTDNGSMHDIHRECCGEYLGKAYHSGGEGTCISAAICEHCATEYGLVSNSENHASEEFIYKVDPFDATQHIKAYACCGKEVERAGHSNGDPSCTHGAICEHCGYDNGEKIEHTYANACTSQCATCGMNTRAASFHIDTNGDELCDGCGLAMPKEKLSGGAVSGIATASTVAVGSGGFSLVWFVIKKKKWADLVKLLIG